LVVANRTLLGDHLLEVLRARAEGGDARFHLVVPAGPVPGFFTHGEAQAAAAIRLEEGLAKLKELGLEATGAVGDGDPVTAINDAMLASPDDGFDEIILSTLPPGPSRWIGADVPHRVRRRFEAHKVDGGAGVVRPMQVRGRGVAG
jgi:hypothetical protein